MLLCQCFFTSADRSKKKSRYFFSPGYKKFSNLAFHNLMFDLVFCINFGVRPKFGVTCSSSLCCVCVFLRYELVLLCGIVMLCCVVGILQILVSVTSTELVICSRHIVGVRHMLPQNCLRVKHMMVLKLTFG